MQTSANRSFPHPIPPFVNAQLQVDEKYSRLGRGLKKNWRKWLSMRPGIVRGVQLSKAIEGQATLLSNVRIWIV